MGTDPFDPLLTPELLFERLQKRKTAIKPTLLDQKLIAGIGNIYASEILFAAGIRPTRRADRLSRRECGRLLESVRAVLTKAIDNALPKAAAESAKSYRTDVQPFSAR